ncbi:MAG: prolipoprotein diacylglyceryl transferase [Frankiales bacterium]|nr:prolipoprotein diacylglyceryl transferase [Frankiales bacterium]
MLPASIPSPSSGVIHLGPLPIRAYALCIIAGIVVAVVVGDRRMQAKGARRGVVADIATWAVPFGLVGARLYHVVTDPELYWGHAGQGTVAALEIWHGGLGIWGAIAGGALGAYIGCRRAGVRYSDFADAIAPALALAQAVGRWGNYFNQELYGRASSLPWAVRIDAAHRPTLASGAPDPHSTYQPTFLYESLWDIGVALLVIWADRRWNLTRGRAFALYAAAYTAGRFWIEALRVDPAHRFLGLRLNDWTSVLVFVVAAGYLVLRRRRTPSSAAEADGVGEEPALEERVAGEEVSG